jgi:hypothetical protein
VDVATLAEQDEAGESEQERKGEAAHSLMLSSQ